MRHLRKHWRKVSISGLLLVFVVTGGLVFGGAGSEIASPSRRPLMDYHHDFLTNQTAHGMRIEPFMASDGTPCLVVSPAGNPGERGGIIRKQLTERGLTLPPFGLVKGTLVLTHGRKGRKEDYLPIAERLCAVGFRCVIPDLPGHGERPWTKCSLPSEMLSMGISWSRRTRSPQLVPKQRVPRWGNNL